GYGEVARPVAVELRAGKEDGGPIDRVRPADAQPADAGAGDLAGEADHGSRGAVRSTGRRDRPPAETPRERGPRVIGKTIAELRVGDRAELTRVVGNEDIADFVEAVGDYNPVHSDPLYAAGTIFKSPIAPGIFTAGLISAVIGTTLPGPGAIYLS